MSTTTEWAGRHNYELNSATVLRDVYRLVSLVLADAEIAFESKDTHDPLAELRERFVEDELVHLLIGSAVANRIQDDHMHGPREDGAELSFQPLRHECGTLRPDVDGDEETTLSFREACNKIIHAVHVTAEIEQDAEAAFDFLPPGIILRGEQNGRSWVAHLNVLEYARASFLNFNDLR